MSPAEEEGLRAALLVELKDNAKKRCPRPGLWGRPLPGRPDPLLVALVEPEGSVRRCAKALEKEASTWKPMVFSPAGSRQALPSLRPLSGSTDGDGSLLSSLAAICAELPGRISRAARFEATCSPYLPGRRRLPDRTQMMRLLALLEGAAMLAWRRSAEDPGAAALFLLESLRLHQDLCRGGTAWIWPYVLRGPLRSTVAVLAATLATGKLDTRVLTSLGAALEVLTKSEPSPASYLRGEQLTVELSSFLSPLMPRGWVPPGGTPSPSFDPGLDVPHRPLGSPRQDLLLGWMAHRMRHEGWKRHCRRGERPARCLQALEGFSWGVAHRIQHLTERWEALGLQLSNALGPQTSRVGSRPVDPGRARRVALEWLVALGPTTGPDHLRRASERLFWLSALRIHVAVLLEQPRRKEPISAGQVLGLPSARRDPFWGEPFVAQGAPGAVEIRPPRPLSPTGDPALRYVISWPIPGAP